MAVDRKQQMKEITERLEQGVKDMPKKEDAVSEVIEKAASVPDNSAQDYSDVPVYYEPFSYAKENDEVDLTF